MTIYRYLVTAKAKNKEKEVIKLTLRHSSEEKLERTTIDELFKQTYGVDLKDITIDNLEIIVEPAVPDNTARESFHGGEPK
jgi:hypothetical protein